MLGGNGPGRIGGDDEGWNDRKTKSDEDTISRIASGMVDILQKLDALDDWKRLCEYSNWENRRLLCDIIDPKGDEAVEGICRALRRHSNSYKGNYFSVLIKSREITGTGNQDPWWCGDGVSSRNSEIIIFHDCPWTTQSCLCRWRKFQTPFQYKYRTGVCKTPKVANFNPDMWAVQSELKSQQ